MRLILSAAALSLIALPAVALAQPRLLSSNPVASATIAKPTKLTLIFSEKVTAKLSGIDLVMTSMPGMADHPPMPIKGFRTTVASDGKTISVNLPRPLPAGTYDLNWRVIGADQSKGEGKYSFTVK